MTLLSFSVWEKGRGTKKSLTRKRRKTFYMISSLHSKGEKSQENRLRSTTSRSICLSTPHWNDIVFCSPWSPVRVNSKFHSRIYWVIHSLTFLWIMISSGWYTSSSSHHHPFFRIVYRQSVVFCGLLFYFSSTSFEALLFSAAAM